MEDRVLILCRTLTFLTLFLSTGNVIVVKASTGTSILILNYCQTTIWPAVRTQKGLPRVTPTGFQLEHLQSLELQVPDSWSGIIWARTACSRATNGSFHCGVGDCGSGHILCHNRPPTLPVTLVRFNLAPKGGTDYYEIDLSNGVNVPVIVIPLEPKCGYIRCVTDLRLQCPNWLVVYDDEGGKMACKSPCLVTGEPRYCCTGAFASNQKCMLNQYTQLVQTECPQAAFGPFSGGKFTCLGGTSYQIQICV